MPLPVSDLVVGAWRDAGTGHAWARGIRATEPTLPVVLMSGYAQSDTEFRRIKPKASGFLQKPFSVDELKNLIRSVL